MVDGQNGLKTSQAIWNRMPYNERKELWINTCAYFRGLERARCHQSQNPFQDRINAEIEFAHARRYNLYLLD